jgi:soluble lytic murein transglycosylase-like protein
MAARERLQMPRHLVVAALNRAARRFGIDPSLARALAWMESGYQPDITSTTGDWGVMQVTPATWDFVEASLLRRAVPHTVLGNIEVGMAYLRYLLRTFGSERLGIAAYHAGATAIRSHALTPEQHRYVANVLALASRV